MRKLGLMASLALAAGLLSQPALADRRVALVIGNAAYQNVVKLANPANDAAAMTDTLKAAQFDVVDGRRDLKATEMRRALRDFADKARSADVAVIYFAGHGIEVDGTNYLIPTDAILERDTDVYDEAFSLERILSAVEPAKKLRLVILDACRDNPFAKTMKRNLASRAVPRGLAKVEPASPNTLIAYSAKAGSTALDGDSKTSPFTAALVRHIATPGLDLRKAFGFVRDEVMKNTGNRQEPYVYGSLGGDDVALVPAPPANADTDARRDYELALQVGTGESWNAFLAQHPSDFYANLARAQLGKIVTYTKSDAPAAPSRLAALPPADAPKPVAPADLSRQLQAELQRVGCLQGAVADRWTSASEKSLDRFNRYAATTFDSKTASVVAFDAVKARLSRVCPLACAHGSRADGDRCVKIVCRAGTALNDDNECARTRSRSEARRNLQRREPVDGGTMDRPQRQARASHPAAPSGQIVCETAGCRPVRSGCHLGQKFTRLGLENVEVCN